MATPVLSYSMRVLAVTVLCLTVAAPKASADPVVVTSGHLYIPWDDPTDFALIGADGFVLRSLFVATNSPQRTCFVGCTPGTAVDLGAVAGGPNPFTVFSLGTLTEADVDGFQWPFGLRPDAPRLAGTLRFEASTIVLPPFADLPSPFAGVFTSPFTFTGQVAGYMPNDVGLSDPLFSVALTGRGTVTAIFDTFGGVYGDPEVTYTFQSTPAPAPVPEPATLILVGTALTGVCIRRYRRRAG
jgi:hypothetical protein